VEVTVDCGHLTVEASILMIMNDISYKYRQNHASAASFEQVVYIVYVLLLERVTHYLLTYFAMQQDQPVPRIEFCEPLLRLL